MTHKTIRRKIVEKAMRQLEEAARAATFSTANFDGIHEPSITLNAKERTKFIKEQTRVYRESWIIPPIRNAIRILENELKGERDSIRDREY